MLSERVLKQSSDGTVQWPGTISGVEALLDNPRLEAIRERHVEPSLAQTSEYLAELHLCDVAHILACQRPENHHIVQAVQELWPEKTLHLLVHQVLHLAVVAIIIFIGCLEAQAQAAASSLLYGAATQVRCHDDQSIGKGDSAALGVCEPAIVQHLQHHVENIRVGLLNLVEEHEGIRPPADSLRECAAVAVADVARRGAYKLGHRMLLHVLTHVQADHCLLGAKEGRRQDLAELRFPDTGRAAEHEAGDGPSWVP
mmetsp:Transcript_80341/g.203187  ORF Transcript_80341/g.203187 Transcript_80341/m.203187 type:complete len:256 (+) Transcript_80341:514-1281(+)